MALSILTRRLLFCFLLIWAGLVIYLFLVHQEQVSHEATKHQQVSWEQRLHLWQHSQRRNNSWAGPCTRCEEGACCWELRNRVLRAEFTDRPYLQWRSFQLTDEALHLPVATFPLFRLLPTTQDFSCSLQGVRRNGSLSLEFDLSCDAGWQVIFRAHLRHEDSHYMRFKVHLVHSEDVVWKGGYRELHLWKLHGSSHVQETKLPQNEEDSDLEDVSGLPVVVQQRFFIAVEHPMAVMTAKATAGPQYQDLTGEIQHLKSLAKPTPEAPWEYSFVIGTFQEASQARRSFLSYLHLERPGRRSPMVHYNSWYDFYSYQDEGFNGGFKDPWPNETLITLLRPDKMSEGRCIQRIQAFGEEMVTKRKTKLDSFLWDDGWDDPHSLWEFDQQRFPRRFDEVAKRAKDFGAGTGVWLSPWGGYGFTQEARVKFGKKQGYETNYNKNIQSEGFSLAGKKYQKVLGCFGPVNMFKFDGVAGNPTELAMEMEAMLRTLAQLRNQKSQKDDEEDVWINLTTGTWPSPFFLFWADSIWRGGPDIATRPKDWYGPLKISDRLAILEKRFVPPPLDAIGLDGLTGRQRWIRWRAMVVYILVVKRSTFFPLSQLMIHGVIVASHGDALHWGLSRYDRVDFTQEVWSFVAMGLQLQELYVAPRHMTPEAWDILAEALRWSRQHAAILRDSHWAFGDVSRYEVYCIASWDVQEAKGFLLFHNPQGLSSQSAPFSLDEVLELPKAQGQQIYQVSLVKTAFRPSEEAPSSPRLPGWNCTASFQSDDSSSCRLRSSKMVKITLQPTEVLVLSVGA
ncbi:unnamed protein product [Durusdinium trenchii]|uniref:Alpha-galactosidase n=1 Tax=Durusdinium trenchii TaxID=1381693 RepID=A0ABP0LJQ9_9DINO